MKISPLLAWLFKSQENGISLGLETMASLLTALGGPEKKTPVFHIAGTNGKGSVAAFSASLLRTTGYRVGLYTSPHLIDFKERIQINGKVIEEEALEEGIRRLQKAVATWSHPPTFFELTTALAFDYFSRCDCDIVVLETGLGGRLDATNLAAPKIACAITPISLDHTTWLGSTLEAIAREKAGIMRSGVPVVTSPQPEAVMEVLKKEAARVGAPLTIINEPVPSNIPLGLVGTHQRWNAAVALTLIEKGPWKLSEKNKQQGLERVSWPGRFQRFQLEANDSQDPKDHFKRISSLRSKKSTNWEQPRDCECSSSSILEKKEQVLILDGAHNIGAIKQLVETWKEEFPHQLGTVIFGALADKEAEAMLLLLKPIASSLFVVPVASSRTSSPYELQKKVPEAAIFSSLEEALEKIGILTKKPFQKENPSSTPILLTGSLFLVGEALALLQGKLYCSSMQ